MVIVLVIISGVREFFVNMCIVLFVFVVSVVCNIFFIFVFFIDIIIILLINFCFFKCIVFLIVILLNGLILSFELEILILE